MKILLVHNRYLQRGGEDAVFEAEKALLERMGHEVIPFVEGNARLNGMNPLKAALNTIWSRESKERLARLMRETNCDVAHFQNTFLMISPAAYYACREAGVPVVQTLHNYRLICPGALLMRDGRVCEDCIGKALPWPGVMYGCWRGSRLQTSVVAAMLTVHRFLKTWTERVDVYIALTEFARRKFITGGLPAEKVLVKPNFVYPDPGLGEDRQGYALFVGRLSPEKGVETLRRAFEKVGKIPLKVLGEGPMRESLEKTLPEQLRGRVEFVGSKERPEVLQMMRSARVLLFLSQWYEGFPMTIAEAFACGLPVVASRLGAMAEIIDDGRTGWLFEPGNAEDLASKVQWAWDHPRRLREMGREARREFEEKYTAERNYEMLMDIYRRAMGKPAVG